MQLRPFAQRRVDARAAVLQAIHDLASTDEDEFVTADECGLVCHATNKLIVEKSGWSAAFVKGAIRELVRDGSVTWMDWRDGLSHRVLILMDHPDAKAYVRRLRRAYGPYRTAGV